MLWIAFFMGLFMVYALSSWLTKLMAMAGYSLGSALNFVILFQPRRHPSARYRGGWLGDRYNIKKVRGVLFLPRRAPSALDADGRTPRSTGRALRSSSLHRRRLRRLGTQILAYAYAGTFYPTAVRSTGVGFASGVGRFGRDPSGRS